MFMRVYTNIHVVQFSSVTQSCLTLCYPKDHSTPGFPVPHQLMELITYVCRVDDAIQPPHPLFPPFPPAFDLPTSVCFPKSQFFISGSQNIGAAASASVPPMNIQD